ncbi:MAG: spondin domain-containing protein, partial [Gemmatimonadota bacterium]|nr:spondin domain-containing protein [Gemmatimonadota bacterium]
MFQLRRSYVALALTAAGLSACGDDTTVPPTATEFEIRVENVSAVYDFTASGVFHTPLGDTQAGPLFPGGIYETVFSAPVGAKLSLATMFGQSNDLFLAPTGDGIPLYDMAGSQLTGDVTGQVLLWDAGTEANQEPGLGADQAPRQASPNTGAA